MEFFEKAHVLKNKDSLQKDSKSEEKVKKKLKQMLYGFKQSDNEIIRNSANIENDFEDSSSVSGFSDLNITNSSIDLDVTDNIIRSDDKQVKTLDFKDDVSSDSSKNDDFNASISISEYTPNLQSLSDDLVDDNSTDLNLELSLDSSNVDSSASDTDTSSEFDADGALANKILEKLGKSKSKEKDLKKIKKDLTEEIASKKRKLKKMKALSKMPLQDVITEGYDSSVSDSNEDVMSEKTHTMTVKPNQYLGPYRPRDSNSDQSIENQDFVQEFYNHSMSCESDESHGSYSISSDVDSPAYVSVVAADMPSESLDEILGDYKHSTVKNLPSSSQNVVNTNNSGIFAIESLNNVQINELPDDCLENDLINNSYDNLTNSIQDVDLDDTEASIIPNESTTFDTTFESEESQREDSMEIDDIPFENPVRVYYSKNKGCIFVLKHPTEMYINGKVKVQCLGGTAEIFGYILQEKTYEVYAPNYNYAMRLKTVPNDNVYYGLFNKLTGKGLTVAEAEDIVTTIGKQDCVISMHPLNNRKIEFVEKSSTVPTMFRMNKNVDKYFKKASDILNCTLYLSKPWNTFEENFNWKDVVTYGLDNNQSKGIICGGKGVGKSTFLRYYINKMLSKGPILLIDLDPGQCEMTVAGNVSATVVQEPLLGPNFTHLQNPAIMLNLGMINTMDYTKRYTNAVEELINQCSNDEKLRNLPWIVNTMGMCNNMGLKLITHIILNVKPTFVLQIDSKHPKKRFDSHLYLYTIKCLYQDYANDSMFRNVCGLEDMEYSFYLSQPNENVVRKDSPLAPRDARYLNYLAYFGQLIRGNSLLDVVPFEVNLKDLKFASNVRIPNGEIAKVINGKVVALCQHFGDKNLFILTDKPLTCFGHGIIRGIDREKKKLYIITPTPVDKLDVVNIIVYADWVPELRGQELELQPGIPIPYRTASEYHQRELMFTPKRRFNPLQLIKMLRST